MGDRHLEAAAEAVKALKMDAAVWEPTYVAETAIDAWLSSLLAELPEEAVEAADVEVEAPQAGRTDLEVTKDVLRAFLRSLRDSLASGEGR